MRGYVRALRTPLAITLAVFVAAFTVDAFVPMRELVPYLVMAQVVAMVMAGKHIVVYRLGGLVQAALAAGAVVLVVHVTLGLGQLAFQQLLGSGDAAVGREALGMLGAFGVFSPAMLFFGYLGGVNGRRELRRT